MSDYILPQIPYLIWLTCLIYLWRYGGINRPFYWTFAVGLALAIAGGEARLLHLPFAGWAIWSLGLPLVILSCFIVAGTQWMLKRKRNILNAEFPELHATMWEVEVACYMLRNRKFWKKGKQPPMSNLVLRHVIVLKRKSPRERGATEGNQVEQRDKDR